MAHELGSAEGQSEGQAEPSMIQETASRSSYSSWLYRFAVQKKEERATMGRKKPQWPPAEMEE